VLIHESEFCQSNAIVVQGRAGVLLIDPGVHGHEMACLARDLSDAGEAVVAGNSTHPHWDHLLWHVGLGAAPPDRGLPGRAARTCTPCVTPKFPVTRG
jgi:glyoxylase-like metal-dependent hydrolase (beta-lactamase superfamily II)